MQKKKKNLGWSCVNVNLPTEVFFSSSIETKSVENKRIWRTMKILLMLNLNTRKEQYIYIWIIKQQQQQQKLVLDSACGMSSIWTLWFCSEGKSGCQSISWTWGTWSFGALWYGNGKSTGPCYTQEAHPSYMCTGLRLTTYPWLSMRCNQKRFMSLAL